VKRENKAELGQRCRLGGLEQRDMRGVGVFHTISYDAGWAGVRVPCMHGVSLGPLGPLFLESEDLR
jgi:hypothetical protein